MSIQAAEPATRISVDENTCRNDGLCAQVCPTRVFNHREGQPPEIGNETLCCLCGQCLAACPSGAISHSHLDPSRFERITDRHPVESTDCHLSLELCLVNAVVHSHRARHVRQELPKSVNIVDRKVG